MKRLALFAALLALATYGCATKDPYPPATTTSMVVKPSATVTATPATTAPDKTPLQELADALGKLGNNKLITAVNKDATDTLAWVAQQQALTPPGLTKLQAFRASACPTSIQLAAGDFQDKLKLLQGLLIGVDQQVTGATAQGPEIILFFTKLRYGPAGPLGQDPKALISTLKQDIFERVSAVVDSCRAIIPQKQIDELVQLAGKAGLLAGTGGAAAPLLGILP
jgi:hypothetical protein